MRDPLCLESSDGRGSMSKISSRILVLLGASAVALFAAGATATAGMSELDSYTQALASASREDALAFINEFPESPLVDDLIESLPAVVAPQVCADLSGGGPRLAQDSCKKFQGPPAVAAAVIAAPVVPPAPTPLKLTDPSNTTGSVCEYSSCKAAPVAPAGSSEQPAAGEATTTSTPDPSAPGAGDSAAAPTSDSPDAGAGAATTGNVGGTDAAGGSSAGNTSTKAIPGTDARIGGSVNASGTGNTLGETAAGDVSSTASGNVTGSVGDTRSGSVDGSIGADVGDTGDGDLDGSIGATIGDTGRATVGGNVGGSIGADSDGRGVDGDMRGGVKARVYF
jgi:hypothetical protein